MASMFTAAKFIRNFLAGEYAARGTFNQSLAVAQVEAAGDEMTRAGLRFHMSGANATGQAPVQSLPTTNASWLLFNSNPASSGVTVFIDRLGLVLAGGTAGAGATAYYALLSAAYMPTTPVNANTAGVAITNANPGSANTSEVLVGTNQTLAKTAVSLWTPLAAMAQIGTVALQTQIENDRIEGRIAIPPGGGLALCVVSPSGTSPLWSPYGSWREFPTQME